MLSKKITFYQQEAYGNTLLYVANPFQRLVIQELTGKKTINDIDINNFKKLGLEFEEVTKPRPIVS